MRAPAETLRGRAVGALLQAREPAGHWRGELSSSALSTATAACALALYRRARPGDEGVPARLVAAGVGWIARHQNDDGGWGDTPDSPSNISTTVLAWVALGIDGELERTHAGSVARAEAWLRRRTGDLSPRGLASCLLAAYGDDRTFSVPILTMCALGGRLGEGPGAWREVQPLPFELGALPRRWLHLLGLPVVSYALPALIAIGQVSAHHRPSRNLLARGVRRMARARTLRILQEIQPPDGGFLEAAPLTSFVAMSLIGCGRAGHPVVNRAIRFLVETVRRDGSWPIDTDLAVWLTTLAINALARGGQLHHRLDKSGRERLRRWLLEQQQRRRHPYTGAAPGGWAWTDLPGGVPDADDTSGALLALHHLSEPGGEVAPERAWQGLRWLLDLQNRDGGIPTFCRGWGRMPFDRSSPDLTAHALRAWSRWRPRLSRSHRRILDAGIRRGVHFLLSSQQTSGAWTPLWFGNQAGSSMENLLYGTTRVLLAGDVPAAEPALARDWAGALARGAAWLLAAQNRDGGWGGAPGAPSSVEETALALEALPVLPASGRRRQAVAEGIAWLQQATAGGEEFPASPIGLYFARLWYSERLYPLIFTTSALEGLAVAPAAAMPEAACP